ncbi:hypothetical protein [Ochrobactrum sp. BTU1]|uniref:hypothetical protein n=1 Tax=Ochrobactrum sp. BTU1 TaxID=2840456 RepID=UPI001C05BE83|nr:hypothetical protein KMS41_22265 [Ochrobactrum sp. BTU1]
MKSGIVARSLLGLFRLRTAIASPSQNRRKVGAVKLFLELAEVRIMPTKVLFRIKKPLNFIQMLIRIGFRRACELQQKQASVRVISFNDSDQSVSPQFLANIGMSLKACHERAMHSPIILDRDAIKAPMDIWSSRSFLLGLSCSVNRRVRPVTKGIEPACRIIEKPVQSKGLNPVITPTPYAYGKASRSRTSMENDRAAQNCLMSDIHTLAPEQWSFTRWPVPIGITA